MNGDVMPGQEGVRQERDERKQAQQERRGAGNSLIRPLALRFDTQISAYFMKRDFYR